ncbi:DegV family protein [Oscillibacter valericigenes]|nr:DegV family protein [Oscillibacter valericigenes]
MTKLFTDTSANLPLTLLREYDITVVPFSYTVNGVTQAYNEETDFDGKAFYNAMREGDEVKTSMVNPATAAVFFERALAQGDDVLYIGMSGGISGTAHAAALAAEELRERYPESKIVTIDTYAASLGEGLLVLEAAELLRAGESIEAVSSRILELRPHMCQFFTVDDLAYLKRGGRISGAAALVGTMLGIKPLLRGDETGHIVSCGKVRGNKKAYAELADYFDKRALDKSARIGIAHADNQAGTDYLMGLLRERGFTGECLEVYYEPVTGSHVGPGTVALFFIGTEK